jgi:four helix bundle protein
METNVQKITSFTQLFSWQKGHALALLVYKLTKLYPKEELFGLVSQMRRCGVSITSNIAEGFSRRSSKEKVQFYYIALGSVTELQNQLLLSRDLGFLSEENFKQASSLSTDVARLINGAISKIRIPNH